MGLRLRVKGGSLGEVDFQNFFLKTVTVTLTLGQNAVGKEFSQIWCDKTQPKKSYEGPKLRFVPFCCGFRYMKHIHFGLWRQEIAIAGKTRS